MKKSRLPTIRIILEKVMEIYQVKTKHKYFDNVKYTVMLQLNTPTPPPYYYITVPLEVWHKIFQIFAHL